MRLDHVTIRTTDLQASCAFFRDALGLEPGDHPDVGVPIAWLYAEGKPIIHLFLSQSGSSGAERPADAIDHLALRVDDLTPVRTRLEALGHSYREISVDNRRQQLFVTAPGGIAVEVLSYS